MRRINIEDRGQALEVAHREATGAQDPRWARAPVRGQLVHEAQELGGLAPGRVSYRGLLVGSDGQLRRGQRGLTVQPAPAQPQGDLAGQGDLFVGLWAELLSHQLLSPQSN